jgi:hypothetical protein
MDKLKTKKCEECKIEFEKKIDCSNFNWALQKFCSNVCASKAKSRNMKGICFNTGRTHIKKGQRLSPSTEFKRGQTSPQKGKPNPHFTGANNPKWKGGIYPQHLKERHSDRMKKIRLEVFKRDDYTCKNCGRKRKPKDRVILQIHHIKSFAIHKELRFDINNIVTLCAECHRKTDTYGKNL